MNRYYFLLLMFIITSEVYSTSSSADRCQSVMSKMAQTKSHEEQIRIALDTLSAKNFSYDVQIDVLKAIAHITSETKAPVIQKILEHRESHYTSSSKYLRSFPANRTLEIIENEISFSAKYMSPDGSHTQSVMSKMAETKNREEQIRIALEILENNPWPDVQIAILSVTFDFTRDENIRDITKRIDNTNRIFYKILEQNPSIPVLKSVISRASLAGSSDFLITLLEHPLIKKHELIEFIAYGARHLEGSAGFQVLSAILEKELPLSFETIESMNFTAIDIVAKLAGGARYLEGSAGLKVLSTILEKELPLSTVIDIGVKLAGADYDYFIKILEKHSSNKMVQERVAYHVRYMNDESKAIRVLLALAEKTPSRELENVMYESALYIGGTAEIHFLSTMLEKYPSSPLYEVYKDRKDHALTSLQEQR